MVIDPIMSTAAPLVGGGLFGFAIGYFLKKVAKFVIIGLGAVALFLGFLEFQKMITVNWIVVENQTQSIMTLTAHKIAAITSHLGAEIPIGLGVVGFLPGLAAGLAKG